MMSLKRSLNLTASTLRLLSKAVTNWPWVLLIICILSPISPHMRVPYALSNSDCAYIGTRGMMQTTGHDCPPIAVINTKHAEIIRW